MSGFWVRTEPLAGEDGLLISVGGELDLATAPKLDEALVGAMSRRRVVLDLSELEFVDSSGIRVLYRYVEQSQSNGWVLEVLDDFRANVRQVLTMTGLLAMVNLTARPG